MRSNNISGNRIMMIVAAALMGCMLYSCARMGRPTGGPRDYTPPVFVKSNPAPNALNVKKDKIEIEFNEIIQLKDANDKVVVSPGQRMSPKVYALGKKVIVEFRDTLQSNTTYTIDFGDAILDNNEGNAMGHFAFSFSTGDTLDSLQISGILLNAADLEPITGALVGIHSNLDDSTFRTTPLERISRTDDRGMWTIRNMRPGTYRVYALGDLNRDFKFDNTTENIAFYDSLVVPYTRQLMGIDTLKIPISKKETRDSVVNILHSHFYPNDILLCSFNEGLKVQYMTKYERPEKRKLFFSFNDKNDTLPEFRIINDIPGITRNNWFTKEYSANNDSITYWITDSLVYNNDSLYIEARYPKSDSLMNRVLVSDTLKMFNKRKHTPKKPKKAKNDTLPPEIPTMTIRPDFSSTIEVYSPIVFKVSEPLSEIDVKGFHLEEKVDTIWEPLEFELTKVRQGDELNYQIKYEWEPGGDYRTEVDSMAIKSIYGLYNKPMKSSFKVRDLSEYGKITFAIKGTDKPAFVELLSTSDKPVRKEPVENGKAEFENVLPGTYYARIILDLNQNMIFDTGNYAEKRQPEEVYYYPQKLELKQNWEISQDWNIYAAPIDAQKPNDIKKNKPAELKNKKKDNNEEENEEDSTYDNGMYNNTNPFLNR